MSDLHDPGAPHQPVLYQEILTALRPQNPGHYIDGTTGAGGHSLGILTACNPDGQLLGLDVDPVALRIAQERLSSFGQRVHLVKASYTEMENQARILGWENVNGIVLDLGASSMQFDSADRGFSFRVDGPLDMRFNPSNPVTAADLVNTLPEGELSNILWQYGEEQQSRRIARSIVQARPIRSTLHLAEIVAKASGARGKGHIHPATKTFQALRIAVNRELESITEVLPQAVRLLEPGGRLAIIAFHSLEDRIVKTYFRQESRDCICPPEIPVCVCNHHASLREINHRPIQPADAEINVNARARSARLRIVEKI
jgi:16S rRNA (cytosine1402-N4)-methyltransferase